MSAKNSFNSMDPKAMQALLAVASKKLGTTPDVLKGQLESGVYDRALQGMPQNEAMMLPVSYTHLTLPTTPYV